jgi:hypothetical protein
MHHRSIFRAAHRTTTAVAIGGNRAHARRYGACSDAPAMRVFLGSLLFTFAAGAATARATPSTTMWAPSTAGLQGFGVLHVTYDTYFGKSAYPIDVGLTIGVLPLKQLQLEVGADLFYPTMSGEEALKLPVQLNAKVGTPEDTFFAGQPGWSAGIYGVGFEEDVTDYNILYATVGKTLPYVGTLSAGGYYGLNGNLLVDKDGEEARAGLLVGWASPAIDLPLIDKLVLAADVQTGSNALGAVGAGGSLYFTPAIALLTGPVFFLEKEVQPGGASWMWSVQLDVDIDLVASQ